MEMTLDELIVATYAKLRETRSNWATSEADVTRYINDGIHYLAGELNARYLQKQSSVSFNTTTLTSMTASNLQVASTSGFVVGGKVAVYADEETYEVRTISAITTYGIGVTEDFVNTYSADDIVISAVQFLPYDCKTLIKAWVDNDPSGDDNYVFKVLEEYSVKDALDSIAPTVVAEQPTSYILGSEGDSETSVGSYTAGTGTTSTHISSTSITAPSGYYEGWLCINETRKRSSRISAHYLTGITLTNAITGQVSTDTFSLVRRLPSIELYPIPMYGCKVNIQYIKSIPDLVNLWDVPLIKANWHRILPIYAATQALAKDDEKVQQYGIRANELQMELRKMKAEEHLSYEAPRLTVGGMWT